MKRVKLISIILAVSVLLCSCSDKTARRNDEEAVEETEAEVQTIPLTRENLEGTWIDDTGFVCRIDPDNDLFTDAFRVNAADLPQTEVAARPEDALRGETRQPAHAAYRYCRQRGDRQRCEAPAL